MHEEGEGKMVVVVVRLGCSLAFLKWGNGVTC